MEKIAIVTDSTADLPSDLYKGYDLSTVPLSVAFRGRTYLDDGVDIKEDDFFEMMKASVEMPKASQPTPGDFINIYDSLIKKGKTVISVHISRKLSGTLNSAEVAARQFEKRKIEIIDSELVHMPCGFMALKAAEMAAEGYKKEEILREISIFRNKLNSFFIPKTLDNLIKGGRINKIKGRLATLLEVKPILTLKDGEVSLFKNARKWGLAKKELLNSMEGLIKGSKKLVVSIGDVANREDADEMEQNIRERFNPFQIIRVKIGIVVGSHLDIGGLGVNFYEE